jgi:hypothetical protein
MRESDLTEVNTRNREACAHTFQSRVSGSLSELTRLRFVRRVVEADFRFSTGSNRVPAGVNGMIVVGIAASRFSFSSWCRRSLKNQTQNCVRP